MIEEESSLLRYAMQQFAMILKKKQEEGCSQTYLAKILSIDQPKISQAMQAMGSIKLHRILYMMELLGAYVVIDTRQKSIEKKFHVFYSRQSTNPPYIITYVQACNIV